MNFEKLAFSLSVAALVAGSVGAATVTKQVVRQQWPWDKKVTIDYRLEGEIGEKSDVDVTVTVAGETFESLSGTFTGDLDSVRGGDRRIVWDPVLAGCTNAAITAAKFELTAKPAAAKYLLIEGLDTETPTVASLYEEPTGGFNKDAYKQHKLVLRRIRAGRFMMGSPVTEPGRSSSEGQHLVILTNDYWIGVFPVTSRQWMDIKTDVTPVDHYNNRMTPAIGVSWNHICGSSVSTVGNDKKTAVEPSSFLGLLGAKVNAQLPAGYVVALPSEAQWEYACRAGTTTAWNNGTDPNYYDRIVESTATGQYVGSTFKCDDNLSLLARYVWTTRGVAGENNATKVGLFLPNAWGLYDCHGASNEWVFDTIFVDGGGKGPEITQVEPRNVVLPRYRLIRGGTWNSNPQACRSASKSHADRASASSEYSFRLAIIKEVK